MFSPVPNRQTGRLGSLTLEFSVPEVGLSEKAMRTPPPYLGLNLEFSFSYVLLVHSALFRVGHNRAIPSESPHRGKAGGRASSIRHPGDVPQRRITSAPASIYMCGLWNHHNYVTGFTIPRYLSTIIKHVFLFRLPHCSQHIGELLPIKSVSRACLTNSASALFFCHKVEIGHTMCPATVYIRFYTSALIADS